MNEDVLHDFVCNHSIIICYGAGDYANRILVYLQSIGKDVDCFVVSEDSGYADFLGRPLFCVSDADKWKKEGAGLIVAVHESAHDSIRKILDKYWNGDTLYIFSDAISFTDDERYGGEILKNMILCNRAFPDASELEAEVYEEKISLYMKKFTGIEIRELYGNLAGLSSQYIYYKNVPGTFNVYHLFYPKSLQGITNNQLDIPNKWLIKKFKGKNFESINEDNFSFWKYFMMHYPKFFRGVIDDFYKENIISDKLNRMNTGELSKNTKKIYINFSDIEKRKGDAWINEHFHGMPFICIFSRDAGYYKSVQKAKDYDLDDMDLIRNLDIDTFDMVVEYFFKQQILSARMGVHAKAEFHAKGCIDFALNEYSPFLDAYLNAKCKFFIGNLSGAAHFTELFSKPFAILSPVLFFADDDTPLIVSLEQDIMILQKYWDKKRRRYLNLREMIDVEQAGLLQGGEKYCSQVNIFKWYAENTIPVKNTKEEVLDLAIEMNDRIDGCKTYDALDEELQHKFWEIMDNSGFFKGIPIRARIGAKFLQQNQWLLN